MITGDDIDLGNGVDALAVALEPAHQGELGLPLGEIGLGLAQLGVDRDQLLVVEQAAALRADQVVLGLVALDRLVGDAQLLLEGAQPLVQPGRGAIGREQLGFELVVDIDLGDPVGDARRLDQIQRGEADRQHIGGAVGGDLEILGEHVDGALASDARGIALEDRRRRLVQPQRRLPVLWDQRYHLAERLAERDPDLIRRLQRQIELRILEQVQLVHHPGEEVPRLHQLHLGRERRAFRGHVAGEHGLEIEQLVLLRVDQHRGRRGVVGGEKLAEGVGADGAERDHERHHQLAAPQHVEQGEQVDRVVARRGVGRLDHPSCHSRACVHAGPTCRLR